MSLSGYQPGPGRRLVGPPAEPTAETVEPRRRFSTGGVQAYEATVEFHHNRWWPHVLVREKGGLPLELRSSLGGAPGSPSRSRRRALRRAAKAAVGAIFDGAENATLAIDARPRVNDD